VVALTGEVAADSKLLVEKASWFGWTASQRPAKIFFLVFFLALLDTRMCACSSPTT
jgi:hypothetical protein